jgi:hypothetical protein
VSNRTRTNVSGRAMLIRWCGNAGRDGEDGTVGPVLIYFRSKAAQGRGMKKEGATLIFGRHSSLPPLRRKANVRLAPSANKYQRRRQRGLRAESFAGAGDATLPALSLVDPPSSSSSSRQENSGVLLWTTNDWLCASAIKAGRKDIYGWSRPRLQPSQVVTVVEEPEWSWEVLLATTGRRST